MRDGWQSKKLGDVCSFLNRGISPTYLQNEGICVLNQKCIRDHIVNYESSRRHDIKAKAVDSKRFIQLGDVLVNSTGTGTLGRVAQIREPPREPTTVDSHVTIVRPKSGMFHVDFFGYMLVMIEDAIKDAGEGCGGQTELSRAVLAEKFSISYPMSILEQQRIVSILDEAFEGISNAKTKAEKNLKNARAIFESYLNDIFSNKQKKWNEKCLGELCSFKNGQAFKKSAWSTSGLPIIRIQNLNNLDSSFNHYSGHYNNDILVKKGDLLFSWSGTVGSSFGPHIWERENGLLNQHIFLVSCNNELNKTYAYYILKKITKEIERQVSGAVGLVHITKEKLKKFCIPTPSIKEQQQIVRLLDSYKNHSEHLVSIYQKKLSAIEELTKSILHQAFAGNL